MRTFILFTLGLLCVAVCVDSQLRDRFADVEEITNGNCSIDLTKLRQYREADNWRDVKLKTMKTLKECAVNALGPGAICFLGRNDAAMIIWKEKIKAAGTNIEKLWTDGECESTDENGILIYNFMKCKQQDGVKVQTLIVAEMAGHHIKTSTKTGEETDCDLLKDKKAVFKTLLGCMPRTLKEELFGKASACKDNFTATEIISDADLLDETTIKSQMAELRKKGDGGNLADDAILEFGRNEETLAKLNKAERKTLKNKPKAEKEEVIRAALKQKRKKEADEEVTEDKTASNLEKKRKKKAKAKSKESLKKALKMKEVIDDPEDMSEEMQRPVLREPSLMQCIAVKDSKMFSSAVACNSTDDTDPLEDSTAQVGKRMMEKCRNTEAAKQKGTFIRHSTDQELEKHLNETKSEADKMGTIKKLCADPSNLTPKQRKVIKKQTKMLMSESLNEDKLEHVFCGLAEINLDEVKEKLTTPELKQKFCKKMKDIDFEDDSKMEAVKQFCLTVDGVKPSDLGEAVCNITEGEVNAMDEETVYGSMESLCRYTCTASAKRAIVEKMKTKLGAVETFLVEDISSLAPCLILSSEEDKQKVDAHADLGGGYRDISESMEGAKAYCKRRGSCEQEVTDGIADAVDSGLVPTAMQAFIEGSASSETKRRRKRALTDIEPSRITCDNIDSIELQKLPAAKLGELNDMIFQNCPGSVGATEHYNEQQLTALAEGVKKVYPDISSWTEENLLEFRVILLGLDSQTIGMLNLTEDVLAEIGSVDAMLQSNTKLAGLLSIDTESLEGLICFNAKPLSSAFVSEPCMRAIFFKFLGTVELLPLPAEYEAFINRWITNSDPQVTVTSLSGAQLSMLQNMVCGINASDMADIAADSYEKASTIIGELKCLTMEQGSALAVRAMAAYGDSPENYNTNRSILASIGVIAGYLNEEILGGLDSEAVSSLPQSAIPKIAAQALRNWPIDNFDSLTKEQAMAFTADQRNAQTDPVRERIDLRRQGREWTDNTAGNDETDGNNDESSGDSDDNKGDREPIRDSDELPPVSLRQICSAADLDDTTLKSLENVKGTTDIYWHVDLLCENLFQDTEALKKLSQLENFIIAKVVASKLKSETPTANQCPLHAAACWALDERKVRSLEPEVAKCIATDSSCCKNQRDSCEMAAGEAFGRKLFKNFISTAQSKEALLPHLRSFCCYQEDWYRADMMEMFKRYGQPDNEFDAAVTCACSDRVLMRVALESQWSKIESPKDLTTEAERTEYVKELAPEELSFVKPEDFKDFNADQAAILLNKSREQEERETKRNNKKLEVTDVRTRVLATKVLEGKTLAAVDTNTQCNLLKLKVLSPEDIKQANAEDFCPLLSTCFPSDDSSRARSMACYQKCKSRNIDLVENNHVVKHANPSDLGETLSSGDVSENLKNLMSSGADKDMLSPQLKVCGAKAREQLENNPGDANDLEKMKAFASLAYYIDDGSVIFNAVTDNAIKKEMCYKLAESDVKTVPSSKIRKLIQPCMSMNISRTKMLCGEDSDKMTFTSFLDSGTTDLLTTDELKICMPRLQAAVGSSQIREKIAGLLIPTLNYSDANVLNEMGTFVDYLTPVQWDEIPQGALCDMLERYYSVVASQRETANARSENGFKSGSGSATEAFGESETRTEVRNRLLQAYQACTDDSSGNRKRRRRSNSVTLTCDIVEILGEDLYTLSLTELGSLSDTDFEECQDTLGAITSFSQEQWQVLAEQAIQVYGSVHTWNDTYVLKSLAGIISGLSVENLAKLVLDDLDVLQSMGTSGDWSNDEKVMAAFSQFLTSHPDVSEGVSVITGTHLIAMGYIACGMTSEQITMLNSQEFCDAVDAIGQLDNCEDSQITEFAKHAKTCFGDDVSAWTTSQVTSMGMLIGGLGEADLQKLTEPHINMIEPKYIALIPNTAINDFTIAQLEYLSVNQAASLTVGQLSSLSSEQLQVISETLDGLDDVDQPTVGDNNDDNMDSGCGVLETSVITLLPLLLTLFCTL